MTPYYSFLLRLWRVSDAEPPLWRVSLENPHTREVLGFDELETLLEYLQSLTRETGLSHPGEAETHPSPLRHEGHSSSETCG